jgi:hypothetical protein
MFPDARRAGFLTEAARAVTGTSLSALVAQSNVSNFFEIPFFVSFRLTTRAGGGNYIDAMFFRFKKPPFKFEASSIKQVD